MEVTISTDLLSSKGFSILGRKSGWDLGSKHLDLILLALIPEPVLGPSFEAHLQEERLVLGAAGLQVVLSSYQSPLPAQEGLHIGYCCL